MKLCGLFFIISLEVIKITNAAPTLNHAPDPDVILRLVHAAADDFSSIAVAKAAAVGFAGGVAVNSVRNNIPDVSEIYNTVANRGNVALKSASRVGENSWKYVKDVSGNAVKVVGENVDAVRNVDPMEVLNETESAMLAKNEAILKGLFDAKRKAFLALQDFAVVTGNFTSQQLDATNENLENLLNFTNSGFTNILSSTANQWDAMNAGMQALLNSTLENFNLAINNAQSGIQVSKETISDISSQMTIENAQIGAQAAIENAQTAAADIQDTITSGIDSTITAAGDATSHVINSIVEAKSGIQDAAENFDSKSAMINTKKQIGNAVVSTIEGAGSLLEQAGVYKAIDSIVHSFAGVPIKINTLLEEAQDTISNSSVVFEFIWENEDPTKNEELTRTNLFDVQPTEEEEVDDEITKIEDEVEAIEEADYLEGNTNEDTEIEDEIKTKTKEILQLMENIDDKNNAINPVLEF